MSDNVWSFVPEEGYTEGLSFLTEVMRTYTAEQRIKLRRQPRKTMSYSCLLNQEQLAQAKLKARRYGQTQTMYIPLWSNQKFMTGIGSGDTVLDFGTDLVGYYEYNLSDKVIIWSDWDNYVTRDIASTTNSTITLSASVGVAYANAIVMPLRQAVAYDGFSTTEDSPNQSYISTKFTLKESDDAYGYISYDLFDLDNIFSVTDIFSRPPDESYGGVFVLPDVPYRLTSVEDQILQPVTIIDNQFGPIVTEPHYDYINSLQTIELFWNNAADRALKVRDFISGQAGRLKTFYLPTFNDDIVPLPGTYLLTVLDIEDYGQATDYVGRDIMIELNDGTKTYNTINAAVDATSQITLTLANTITLNTTTLKRISFMNLVRCDVDDFEFYYSAGNIGTTRFTVIEVPN